MISTLYIDLSPNIQNYTYEKEVLSNLRGAYPDMNILDIDAGSESFLIDHAIRLLKDSSRVILIVESTPEQATKILPFAELISTDPDKYLVILKGENQWLIKICKGIGENYLKKNLSSKEELDLIREFIQ